MLSCGRLFGIDACRSTLTGQVPESWLKFANGVTKRRGVFFFWKQHPFAPFCDADLVQADVERAEQEERA